jgi:thioredoxin reductase
VEGGSVVGVEFARTRIVGGPSTTVASLPALGMTSVTDDERRIGDDAAKVAIEVVEGSEFVVACDTVVRAIGQSRLISTLGALGVQHDGGVVRVDERMRTTRQGVFAAGDCIFAKGSREAMVVEAAEQGKIAASSVNEYLAMTSGKHPRAAGGNSSGARDDG